MSDWLLTDGVREIVLGKTLEGVGLERLPIVDSSDVETDDVSLPRSDGIAMGDDFLGGTRIGLAMEFRSEGPSSAAAVLDSFRNWWRSPKFRTGGNVVELRSPEGRSAFGRPRELTPNRDKELFDVISVDATFEAVSDLWFGASGSALVSLVPPLGRGLVAPLVEPLTIQGVAQNASGFTVGGSSAVFPIIEFRGPISNPSLHGPGWELRVRGSLAYDETLVVDTRPWKRTLALNGRPVAGMLMPSSSRLRDVTFEPGFHSVQLRGTDITGTASALISWRETFASF